MRCKKEPSINKNSEWQKRGYIACNFNLSFAHIKRTFGFKECRKDKKRCTYEKKSLEKYARLGSRVYHVL